MNCPECNGKGDFISADGMVCRACGDRNVIRYFKCCCGCVWREDKFGLVDNCNVNFDIFAAIEEKLGYGESCDVSALSDYIHKCLQCGSTAYMVSDNGYRCSDSKCGFEWEVLRRVD